MSHFPNCRQPNPSLEPRKEIVSRWITACNRGEIAGYVRVFLAAMRALKSKLPVGLRWQREYRRPFTKSDVMDQKKTATFYGLAACRPINMLRHNAHTPKKRQEIESCNSINCPFLTDPQPSGRRSERACGPRRARKMPKCVRKMLHSTRCPISAVNSTPELNFFHSGSQESALAVSPSSMCQMSMCLPAITGNSKRLRPSSPSSRCRAVD